MKKTLTKKDVENYLNTNWDEEIKDIIRRFPTLDKIDILIEHFLKDKENYREIESDFCGIIKSRLKPGDIVICHNYNYPWLLKKINKDKTLTLSGIYDRHQTGFSTLNKKFDEIKSIDFAEYNGGAKETVGYKECSKIEEAIIVEYKDEVSVIYSQDEIKKNKIIQMKRVPVKLFKIEKKSTISWPFYTDVATEIK